MSHAPSLRLYYRNGCGLCEDMQRELYAAQARYGYELKLVDVDTSATLVEAYGHKVPVLTGADDEEICHYFLDHEALQDYFSGA